ncbi:putative Glycogen synthase [Giardia muris]|uniref:Glycogen [starch] synthase n=1 Tax=Giardia muris TaxID=5742 RepID=A0A4Z1SLT7_GIAMU|nr:putative Glycogen synthase [Giardia muris]|eukprot:TNJ26632.1 putative Glycogen synthase [Giardia muris]
MQTGGDLDPSETICLEFCYETIHKVGGIETVVRTKAPAMGSIYGDNYFMVGPHIAWDEKFLTNFEEAERTEDNEVIYELVDSFERRYGLKGVKYGRWLTPGIPQVILLPLSYEGGTLFEGKVNQARDIIRARCQLDIPNPAFGEREPFAWNALVFGVAGWCFLSHAMQVLFTDIDVVVHSHEWLGCVTQVLYASGGNCETGKRDQNAFFVFTTHATTLGRHLSAGNVCLTDCLKVLKERPPDECASHWDAEACHRRVAIEHRLERAAAHTADVFTTVSEITGREAECFLGRAPDIITYNGMDVSAAQRIGSAAGRTHEYYRRKIIDFCRGHFSATPLVPEKTLIFFSAGRLEYRNKGYDMFIDALHRLNERLFNDPLLEDHRDITVVGIIIAPAPTAQYQVETLRGVSLMREIKDSAKALAEKISGRLVDLLTTNRLPYNPVQLTLADVLERDDIVLLKRYQQSYSARHGLPSILTHTLRDPSVQDAKEPILVRLRELNLVNQREAKVKVVWIPEFVSKTSPVGLDYGEFTAGGSLGVFCSLYEPWGYTSPECCCVGTPSIVSNLCGFGSFIEAMTERDRFGKRSEGIIEASERLHHLAALSSLANRKRAVPGSSNSSSGACSPSSTPATGRLPPKSVASVVEEHERNVWNTSRFGVQVVDRVFASYGESVDKLTSSFVDYIRLTPEEREMLRQKTARASVLCDWSTMIDRYREAHSLAVSRGKRNLKSA